MVLAGRGREGVVWARAFVAKAVASNHCRAEVFIKRLFMIHSFNATGEGDY